MYPQKNRDKKASSVNPRITTIHETETSQHTLPPIENKFRPSRNEKSPTGFEMSPLGSALKEVMETQKYRSNSLGRHAPSHHLTNPANSSQPRNTQSDFPTVPRRLDPLLKKTSSRTSSHLTTAGVTVGDSVHRSRLDDSKPPKGSRESFEELLKRQQDAEKQIAFDNMFYQTETGASMRQRFKSKMSSNAEAMATDFEQTGAPGLSSGTRKRTKSERVESSTPGDDTRILERNA